MKVVFEANYLPPNQQRIFLKHGWGIRDIRGPYINKKFATLCIDSIYLSAVESTIATLYLAASNRLPIDAVIVKVSTNTVATTCLIRRNCEISVDVLCERQTPPATETITIEVPYASSHLDAGLLDVIALNRVRLALPREPGCRL